MVFPMFVQSHNHCFDKADLWHCRVSLRFSSHETRRRNCHLWGSKAAWTQRADAENPVGTQHCLQPKMRDLPHVKQQTNHHHHHPAEAVAEEMTSWRPHTVSRKSLWRVSPELHWTHHGLQNIAWIANVHSFCPPAPGYSYHGETRKMGCRVQALISKVRKHPELKLETLLAGSRKSACSRPTLPLSRVTRVL